MEGFSGAGNLGTCLRGALSRLEQGASIKSTKEVVSFLLPSFAGLCEWCLREQTSFSFGEGREVETGYRDVQRNLLGQEGLNRMPGPTVRI